MEQRNRLRANSPRRSLTENQKRNPRRVHREKPLRQQRCRLRRRLLEHAWVLIALERKRLKIEGAALRGRDAVRAENDAQGQAGQDGGGGAEAGSGY